MPRQRNVRVKDGTVDILQGCYKDPKCKPTLENLEAGKYQNIEAKTWVDCISSDYCSDVLRLFHRSLGSKDHKHHIDFYYQEM